MEEDSKQNTMKSIKTLVETELKEMLEMGIQPENIDNISKLIDIHKDIENEQYWNKKEEVYEMRYYNDYRDDRYSGNYGRRGVPGTGRGRYRGAEDKVYEMMDHYSNYSAASDAANNGNYGAEEDSVKYLDKMLNCVCVFMDMLEEEASSQEEAQMVKKYRKRIAE